MALDLEHTSLGNVTVTKAFHDSDTDEVEGRRDIGDHGILNLYLSFPGNLEPSQVIRHKDYYVFCYSHTGHTDSLVHTKTEIPH